MEGISCEVRREEWGQSIPTRNKVVQPLLVLQPLLHKAPSQKEVQLPTALDSIEEVWHLNAFKGTFLPECALRKTSVGRWWLKATLTWADQSKAWTCGTLRSLGASLALRCGISSCSLVSEMHPDIYLWCCGNERDLFSALRSATLGLHSNGALYITSTQFLHHHSALLHSKLGEGSVFFNLISAGDCSGS